jgi:hypothetical protein
MEDTFKLIQFYKGARDGKTPMDENMYTPMQPLKDYGAKYGLPVKGTTVFAILAAIDDMRLIIEAFNLDEHRQDRIDFFCTTIAEGLRREIAKEAKPFYKLMFASLERNYAETNNIYMIPGTDNEFPWCVFNYEGNRYWEDTPAPILRLKCSASDLTVLEKGNYANKLKHLKSLILDGYSDLLNRSEHTMRIMTNATGTPTIYMITENHFLFFIFKILSREYTTCEHCGTILANGNRWCDKRCRKASINATPKAKLERMVNNWLNRGRIINSSQYDILMNEGKELLNFRSYEEVKTILRNKVKGITK